MGAWNRRYETRVERQLAANKSKGVCRSPYETKMCGHPNTLVLSLSKAETETALEETG